MPSDSELVSRCLKGDSLAQKQFYDRFARQMLGVCFRYVQNLQEAEDVLQEGFIRAFRYMKDFRNEGSLEGWLRRIMITTALNFIKKEIHVRNEEDVSMAYNESSDQTDALQRMENNEIMDLIRQLSSGYRTVLNLFAIEGFSHKEIGELLGIEESTSRSQYARARQLLKKKIETHSNYGLINQSNAK
jgi:RNA polymerase sigma-70 factor (ECF subfamily)